MDTLPAQEIPAQQIPAQPVTPIPSVLPSNSPQGKRSIKNFLNLGSWIILFAFLPITVLIFLSQNTIPGDFFYPVKRSMENVILAAASVSPATRAAFRTDLTEARFKEAQGLIVSRSNTSGLTTFIDDIQSTQFEVANLKNDTQRDKAEEKLLVKIEEYQSGLSTLEAKTEQAIITYQFQEIPAPTFTPTPTLVPTSIPTPSSSFESQPTPIPTAAPTLTLTPAVVNTSPIVPSQQENTQITEQKKIAQTIKETKITLEKIKKDLEEKRKEEKEKHEERNESEENDKENKANKKKRDSSDEHK